MENGADCPLSTSCLAFEWSSIKALRKALDKFSNPQKSRKGKFQIVIYGRLTSSPWGESGIGAWKLLAGGIKWMQKINMQTNTLWAAISSLGTITLNCWLSLVSLTIKDQNHSIDQVQNLGNERRWIYKQPCQESGLCNFTNMQDTEECLTQIYRALYGDAMLVSLMRGTNMVAGNQQEHLLLSFATILFDHYLRNRARNCDWYGHQCD